MAAAAQFIGVFDSGVGGLSVWREITTLMPHENTFYLADQARVPYGARPIAEIEALTHTATGWLLDHGAKLVVIACNTASSAALSSLRERWPDVPIVGMEPAVKPAGEHTRSGRVGVMATPSTLQGPRFAGLVERFASGIEVYTQICPGLVEWVEAGNLAGPLVSARLHELLDPLVAAGIDHLVLGCTHYPFLAPAIQQVVGADVQLIDPSPAVARQTLRLLHARDLAAGAAATARHHFYTTAAAPELRRQIRQLLGLPRPRVTHVDLALVSDLSSGAAKSVSLRPSD